MKSSIIFLGTVCGSQALRTANLPADVDLNQQSSDDEETTEISAVENSNLPKVPSKDSLPPAVKVPCRESKAVVESPKSVEQQAVEATVDNTQNIDQAKVDSAALFLSMPEWKNIPEKKVRKFLLTKGYTEQEMDQAFSKRTVHVPKQPRGRKKSRRRTIYRPANAEGSSSEENVIQMPPMAAVSEDAKAQSPVSETAKQYLVPAGNTMLKPLNLNPAIELKPNGYKVVYADVRAKKGYELGEKLGFQVHRVKKGMLADDESGDTYFHIVEVFEDSWAAKYTDLQKCIGYTLCKINGIESATIEEFFAARDSLAGQDDIVFTLRKYMPVRSEKPAKTVEFAYDNAVRFIGHTDDIDKNGIDKDSQYNDDGYAGGSGYSVNSPLGWNEALSTRQSMRPPSKERKDETKTMKRQKSEVTKKWRSVMCDDDKSTTTTITTNDGDDNDDGTGIAFQKQWDAVMTLHKVFDFNSMCPEEFAEFQELKVRLDKAHSYVSCQYGQDDEDFKKEFDQTMRNEPAYLDLLIAFEYFVEESIRIEKTFSSATEMLAWYQDYSKHLPTMPK